VSDDRCASRLDELFALARLGEPEAFAEWMGMVELPLRRSLRRFARAVDVEVVMQETFMRMWLVASDLERSLEGTAASLKFAFRVVRNVALEEIRRNRLDRQTDLEHLEDLPEGSYDPEPGDPALARAIADCFRRLPDKPRRALGARLDDDCLPDRVLAERLRMRLNTFLQNVVRARRSMEKCLEGRGVRLEEVMS
jgi:DNA-directed RNA polymerase specialized sigma24 family protein